QQLHRVGVPVGLADVADLLPPPVAEPAVAAARTAAADVGFEEDHVEVGLPFLQEPRGPQPRVPAAEDHDVRRRVAFERRRLRARELLQRERLLEPPRPFGSSRGIGVRHRSVLASLGLRYRASPILPCLWPGLSARSISQVIRRTTSWSSAPDRERSPTAPNALRRARCSGRSGSPRRTSASRRWASPRRGTRSPRATTTSASSPRSRRKG